MREWIACAAIYLRVVRLTLSLNRRLLAFEAIQETPGLRLEPPYVETNLVWFEVDPALASAPTIAGRLSEKGILVHPAGPTTLRACTHLDVSEEQTAYVADTLRALGRNPC